MADPTPPTDRAYAVSRARTDRTRVKQASVVTQQILRDVSRAESGG